MENSATDLSCVRDLALFPELCWLDRYDTLVPAQVLDRGRVRRDRVD